MTRSRPARPAPHPEPRHRDDHARGGQSLDHHASVLDTRRRNRPIGTAPRKTAVMSSLPELWRAIARAEDPEL
jgi:hypothetical protein